ncbi:MAG TPA: PH domain-containing protein [Chthoniobacter sp.]|nr:PH domain-containing protein [Chthoniobacter sp.]
MSNIDTVPSAHSLLAQELDPGERLLWSGQPRGGVRLRPQDIYIIPFSLMWGGFAIFWEVMAVTQTSKAPGPIAIVFPLFGVPFVFVGLYFIFGRFFFDAASRARTFYGVTDERIIIISGVFSRQIKSLQLRTLTDVSLTQRNDGSGTITFGPTNYLNAMFPAGAWPGAGRHAPPAFDLLDRAKEVYDIIRRAQRPAPENV